MTPDEELTSLQAKLTASENRPGYEARVTAIKERMAEVQAEIDAEGEDDD